MPDTWPKVGDIRDAHDATIIAPCGEWRELVIFAAECDGSSPLSHCRRHFPLTCQVVERLLPSAVSMAKQGAGEIIFSALATGTHLKPHCASHNARLTCHL